MRYGVGHKPTPPIMFKYNGITEYERVSAIGNKPAVRSKGYWFEDYHRNRQLIIEPLGNRKYHVKMVVLGKVTTDVDMTKQGLVSWAINHLQFQLTEGYFKVMK